MVYLGEHTCAFARKMCICSKVFAYESSWLIDPLLWFWNASFYFWWYFLYWSLFYLTLIASLQPTPKDCVKTFILFKPMNLKKLGANIVLYTHLLTISNAFYSLLIIQVSSAVIFLQLKNFLLAFILLWAW